MMMFFCVCLLRYALLVGRPPFETSTLKETYVRIANNNYTLPQTMSVPAQNFIRQCLNHEPELRPSLNELANHEFFSTGFLPRTLPSSCCTTVPKFPVYNKFNRLIC